MGEIKLTFFRLCIGLVLALGDSMRGKGTRDWQANRQRAAFIAGLHASTGYGTRKRVDGQPCITVVVDVAVEVTGVLWFGCLGRIGPGSVGSRQRLARCYRPLSATSDVAVCGPLAPLVQ